MAFRDLMADVDTAVKRDLSDDVTIDGKPLQGMFKAPWLGPDLGTQRTQLVAPTRWWRMQRSRCASCPRVFCKRCTGRRGDCR